MYTGDAYLDAKYLYFPSLLSEEELLRAVKTRFPKLPNMNSMNKERLFEFYMEHVFPRPQRKEPADDGGTVLRDLQAREDKREEEEKSWLYPREKQNFRLKRFGLCFQHGSLEELDKKIKLQAEKIIRERRKDSVDGGKSKEEGEQDQDPRSSASKPIVLKRSTWDRDRRDSEPAKKKRAEITWP